MITDKLLMCLNMTVNLTWGPTYGYDFVSNITQFYYKTQNAQLATDVGTQDARPYTGGPY